MKMTRRKKEVITAITELTQANGYAPSIRELCDELGMKSPSSVHRYLKELQQAGVITWDPSCPRTLQVLEGDKCAI